MENKMNKLNDSELEQVIGGKSFTEWEAYFDSIRAVSTEDRRQLLIKAMNEIKNDPDLSRSEIKHLENMKDGMWGVVTHHR